MRNQDCMKVCTAPAAFLQKVAFLHRKRQEAGGALNRILHLPLIQLPIEVYTFRGNLSNLDFRKEDSIKGNQNHPQKRGRRNAPLTRGISGEKKKSLRSGPPYVKHRSWRERSDIGVKHTPEKTSMKLKKSLSPIQIKAGGSFPGRYVAGGDGGSPTAFSRT